MPWFVYNFPGATNQPNSYSLAQGTPSCTGETLCAIYATTQAGVVPARPVITQSIQDAINDALNGVITPNVTLLQPEQAL
jgi:hypothetical protein